MAEVEVQEVVMMEFEVSGFVMMRSSRGHGCGREWLFDFV